MSMLLIFRWCAFLLALGFWLYEFTTIEQGVFGWQFRYLTIWSLTGIVITSWLLLSSARGVRDNLPYGLIASLTALSGVVVLMYWKLMFEDPALVRSGPVTSYAREYYLHALGPLLQWIDVLFIEKGFRRLRSALPWCIGIVLGYVAWLELALEPLNSEPVGSVTDGLPYPFLNDMVFDERVVFYITTGVIALAFLAAGWGICRLLGGGALRA